jgi:hypothetical protein
MFCKRPLIALALLLTLLDKPSAQVNLQTGSAVFSLPMFNWKDDKGRLSSVVALNYTSGNGLKVNDMASNVGQGWSLVAGGVITRLQVGEPDDQPRYDGTPTLYGTTGKNGTNGDIGPDNDITKYPAGYLYATIPASQGCPTALDRYPTYGGQNVLYANHDLTGEDKQQDYFAFQFNGKSGVFILDQVGGDHGVPLADTKLKIAFQRDPTLINLGIRTTITSFTITDVDGLIYKFTQHGTTRLLKEIFSTADGSHTTSQPSISNGGTYCQSGFDLGPTAAPWYNKNMANPYVINNWYLSEIDDPFTGRAIYFSYHTLNLNVHAGQDISYTGSNNGSDNYVVISYKRSVTTTLEPDSILYPDGHSVKFNYASAQRADYPGEYALTSVDVHYKANNVFNFVSSYQLNTSYFILNSYGNPTTTYEQGVSRLCLRSVKKIGPYLREDSPPYTFDYYKGSSIADDYVPPPFFYAKDIWGYYNGNNSVSYSNSTPVSLTAPLPYNLGYDALKGLCFLNAGVSGTYYNAKPGYAQNGLLKEVIYPTGGSLTYTYAQNTGSFMGNSTVMNMGGVHVSQTSSADGGYSNGCATPVVTQYNYVVNGTGSASSLWGLETPVNYVQNNNYWQEEHQTIHFSLSAPFGECKWHYIYPGILSQYEAVSIEGWQKFMNAIAPVLGILSVIGTINDIINVIGPETGPGEIVALVIDVITAVLTYILSCPQQKKTTLNTIYYDFDLNEVSPLPAQFKRVEITESPGTIGKTVDEFTHGDASDANLGTDHYYPLWDVAGNNTSFAAQQRFAPWAYGLPWRVTQYDVNGNTIKQTQNAYDFSNAKEAIWDPGTCCATTYTQNASCKCQVVNSYSQRSDGWSNPTSYIASSPFITNSNGDIIPFIYYFYTGRAPMAKTYEREYRTTDVTQYVQTETDYTYGTGLSCIADNGCQTVFNNYDVKSKTTYQSNGDIEYTYYNYPGDYNTGILDTLCQKNILSEPVATNTVVQKAGTGLLNYLSEKVTEFAKIPNGDIRPYRILQQRYASPLPSPSFIPYSGPTTTNYANYKIPMVYSYDANSNLRGKIDEGGRLVTNIYDYNDKYVEATVINADPNADYPCYTSFENFDLSRSGWTINNIQSYYQNVPAPTGVNILALLSSSGNTLSTTHTLNTAKPYILSFWSSNGNVSVAAGGGSATLVKTGPSYNGFTYYEYNIAQGTASITLYNSTATNANIDEVRLYPATARMQTTTYDPLLGKTSECDDNNRITYYTYDNLGRLQFIRDESGNVVRMYEYNTVSSAKQTGCPVSYSNYLISELFTRNNCQPGYQGGQVTYSVAAGTYNSTVSQQDADIQAEIYLLTNGPGYANANGSCSLIYYNTAQSKTDTTQDCAPGQKGGPVIYTVPANTYSSIISQADANQQALNDITANAQSFANSYPNMSCSADTAADWEWFPGDSTGPADPSYCLSVGGQLPPHLFVLAKDINPGSPTYNQTQYFDYGANNACPANTYYNAQQSQSFTRNNCTGGLSGTTVTYTVPPGKYSSTVSQAAADQQATNDMSANGQNYANANGVCCNMTLTYSSSITGSVMNTVYLSGATRVSFTWVFTWPSGQTSFTLGTLNGSCLFPTSTRTIPFSQGSTTYNLTVSANGTVQIAIISGPTPTGTIGFNGQYDLNLNAWYSAAESGNFTRNNCPSGQTGSTVTYSVAQYAYSSYISQADANQQAINQVNASGQNYANTNGTCSVTCSFTWQSPINGYEGNISESNNTGSFTIVFPSPNSSYSGGTVGTIVGNCKPSGTRNLVVTDGGTSSRKWNVTINTSGVVSITLNTGSPATNSGPPIVLSGTYSM